MISVQVTAVSNWLMTAKAALPTRGCDNMTKTREYHNVSKRGYYKNMMQKRFRPGSLHSFQLDCDIDNKVVGTKAKRA